MATEQHSVLVPFESFKSDEEHRLGRANGNIYRRRPDVPGVHDGQIMIRLKKLRWQVIDYGIVPTAADIETAAKSKNIACLAGAGKQKCVTLHCTKVGVPVLLFDSNPDDTQSLYMRSGLCFGCQRNLNEKRRTVRKRKSTGDPNSTSSSNGGSKTKYRMNGQVVDIPTDSMILRKPAEANRPPTDGYAELQEEIQNVARELSTTHMPALFSAASSAAVAAPGAEAAVPGEEIQRLHYKVFHELTKSLFLLEQWKASWEATSSMMSDPSIADAVAVAAQMVTSSVDHHHHHHGGEAPQPGATQTTTMIPLLEAAAEAAQEHKTAPSETDDELVGV
uniref:Uncharacterized protein n=1 Tax=Grammatophora oceanica TaxID=210454 RepID=A0A7S1UW71_9STRA|mmetsp:Transcript_26736/g.39074  ORF Transcript_26736/g.39074 Transcript_26736/m.39074 type:complete len:335 (+) Transcript_26736:104-1108(+)|eukprot:CAMPEP_0194033710 /NCGR_PEP_ID=MMETSP0009_2-20130614/6287_1 /TAXON_ID=210454 /ORGANISM="Grammatophora oceanica, Strain CCMP 410" /LENGTH=334 /DNA_ID=CAMNT_0038674427 /DNA_START=230 /DNA_END=1234 /DNA_ORIENTATION=-